MERDQPAFPTSTTQQQRPSNKLTAPKRPAAETSSVEPSTSNDADSDADGVISGQLNSGGPSNEIIPGDPPSTVFPHAGHPLVRLPPDTEEGPVAAVAEPARLGHLPAPEDTSGHVSADPSDLAGAADGAQPAGRRLGDIREILPQPVEHSRADLLTITGLGDCLESVILNHSGRTKTDQLLALRALLQLCLRLCRDPRTEVYEATRKNGRPKGAVLCIKCLLCPPGSPTFVPPNPIRRFGEHLLVTHLGIKKPFGCYEDNCPKRFALPQDCDRHEKNEHRLYRRKAFNKLLKSIEEDRKNAQKLSTSTDEPCLSPPNLLPSTSQQSLPSTSKQGARRGVSKTDNNTGTRSRPSQSTGPIQRSDRTPTRPRPRRAAVPRQETPHVVPHGNTNISVDNEPHISQVMPGNPPSGWVLDVRQHMLGYLQVPENSRDSVYPHPSHIESSNSSNWTRQDANHLTTNAPTQEHMDPGMGSQIDFNVAVDPGVSHLHFNAFAQQTQAPVYYTPVESSAGTPDYSDLLRGSPHSYQHPQNDLIHNVPSPMMDYLPRPSHGYMEPPIPQGHGTAAPDLNDWINRQHPSTLDPYANMHQTAPNSFMNTGRSHTWRQPNPPHDPQNPTGQWPGNGGNGSGPRLANRGHWRYRLYSILKTRMEDVSSCTLLFQLWLTALFAFAALTLLTSTDSPDLRFHAFEDSILSRLSRLRRSLVS
ncbi:hypothetical protein M408DRAFT_333821 [Serendipita vermifera MAFF 305830]|uniref:C2H2-type domain-containing protein n=1 Tax=Serendipita vermifera MAFF 305830 TaxID=933852 RepID=A0A0C3AL31_SERVB|nr:hypothetical protein M408DRAFT_333821 [Serendipita vermifera MAFF 305830]